jgi:multiple sugar transport system ATP-binding protein
VTHDQIEAMTMADRIVVMHDGVIEQIGTPLELYDTPANLFVAGFIGSPSMNFVKGSISPEGFRTEDGIVLPASVNNHRSDGQSATYGIRPEHFRLDDNGVPLEIVVVEPTGSETQVLARLGKQNVTGVFRERIDAKPGATIKVSPDIANTHLFDATGTRIN